MTTEHDARVTGVLLTTASDGALAAVMNIESCGATRPIVRVDLTIDWVVSLIDVLTAGAFDLGATVDYPCRTRVDAMGSVVALGRADGSLWFNTDPARTTPASERPIERWPGQTPDGERALRFLNKARAVRGRRDLCPRVAGYTDDDIIADARHYGWDG
jgi:hypothetical protein